MLSSIFTMRAHHCDAGQAARVQGIKQVMLDIEGPTWNFTQSENRVYVSALRSAVEKGGLNVTIYCTNWPETFGSDFTAFKDVPLIYAVRTAFELLFLSAIMLKYYCSSFFFKAPISDLCPPCICSIMTSYPRTMIMLSTRLEAGMCVALHGSQIHRFQLTNDACPYNLIAVAKWQAVLGWRR
jgi:hypothetical protein